MVGNFTEKEVKHIISSTLSIMRFLGWVLLIVAIGAAIYIIGHFSKNLTENGVLRLNISVITLVSIIFIINLIFLVSLNKLANDDKEKDQKVYTFVLRISSRAILFCGLCCLSLFMQIHFYNAVYGIIGIILLITFVITHLEILYA